MTTIKHTKTLVYYDGVQLFAGRDAGGDNYVGAMIDAEGDADRYLVFATAAGSLARLCATHVDLRILPLDASADAWYTPLVDDDCQLPVFLEPQSGSLREMDYLAEAGVHLNTASADDLSPAGSDVA